MFYRIFLVSVFFLTLPACSSAPKKSGDGYVHSQEIIEHEAVCFIDKNVFQEKDLKLETISDGKYIVSAADGKKLALPTDECILKSTEFKNQWKANLSNFFENKLDRRYWISCKLGPVSFMSDDLQYVADEKTFFRMRNKEGVDWSLPRTACKIYPMQAF